MIETPFVTPVICLGLVVIFAALHDLPEKSERVRLIRLILILMVVNLAVLFRHDLRAYILTGLTLIIVVLERIFPRTPYSMVSDEKFRNSGFVSLITGVSLLLSALGLGKVTADHPVSWGLSSHHVSLWIQIPVTFVILDFVGYARHWCTHHYDFLWRFHQIHHATEEVSALSAWGRFHILEAIILINLLPVGVAYLLGVGPEAFVYGFAIPNSMLGGLFAHVNLDFPRSASRLAHFVTNPRAHALHHTWTHDRKNYGVGLMVWDMLFGTFAAPDFVPTVFGNPEIAKLGIFRQHAFALRGLAPMIQPMKLKVNR